MADLFDVDADGARLAGEEAGEGPAVVLCHGLTATRRYVVMGSRALERAGHRVIGYDARGHGESGWGGVGFTYSRLVADLEAVLDDRSVSRAVLAGASMGAHTLLAFALAHPDRVSGLVVITPAFTGGSPDTGRWDRLAAGLRTGGIDGFVAASDLAAVAPDLRGTVETVMRQRLSRHRDLAAIARALEEVPRSRPFGAIGDLAAITVPTAVIASADGPDPEHPQAVAEAYAAAIPGARLLLDAPGRSPRAWQGSQVSAVIAEVVAAAQG
ncbi:alpha/beta fold hydrolase [Conexibacter sp. DBS9H8]|uniref:alpha/beta fold hydrolase n=1 Tax=Conexibacter sp. DBS9H8 TaxID=2937801 RepID=UPI00200C4E43|nr:alpha/beta fold hydrolase [Conexibacter sp. DBS9H8]